MISPAGIPNFLVESSSIAQSAVGVKGLGQAPKMSWAGLHPWEDYNYKSSPKVAGCRLGGPADYLSDPPHRP